MINWLCFDYWNDKENTSLERFNRSLSIYPWTWWPNSLILKPYNPLLIIYTLKLIVFSSHILCELQAEHPMCTSHITHTHPSWANTPCAIVAESAWSLILLETALWRTSLPLAKTSGARLPIQLGPSSSCIDRASVDIKPHTYHYHGDLRVSSS